METNRNNKFEEFLKEFTPKFGQSVFDLSRDFQLDAMATILEKKGIFTKEELNQENDLAIDRMSERLRKIPPVPIPSPFVKGQ